MGRGKKDEKVGLCRANLIDQSEISTEHSLLLAVDTRSIRREKVQASFHTNKHVLERSQDH
jgi:hypothetical protein